MKKVDQDPFSNGTEHMIWEGLNCDRCTKNSHIKEDGNSFTIIKCAIQRDIFTRMFSNEPIAQRTIDICQMKDCPYRKEEWPKRKKAEKHKNEPKLFNL